MCWNSVTKYDFVAGPGSAVGEVSDSRARGFDTRSSHILSFLFLLIQEGQLSAKVCA